MSARGCSDDVHKADSKYSLPIINAFASNICRRTPNNVIAPTGITQTGRSSGVYETIDAVMTAMSVLGHDAAMSSELTAYGARPGLLVHEVMR